MVYGRVRVISRSACSRRSGGGSRVVGFLLFHAFVFYADFGKVGVEFFVKDVLGVTIVLFWA
jgi:hypothetical protein